MCAFPARELYLGINPVELIRNSEHTLVISGAATAHESRQGCSPVGSLFPYCGFQPIELVSEGI